MMSRQDLVFLLVPSLAFFTLFHVPLSSDWTSDFITGPPHLLLLFVDAGLLSLRVMQNGNPPTSRVRHRKRSTVVVQDAGKANGDQLLVNDQNKYRSMLIRAYSSLWMLAGFALITYMGHLFITAMVVVIQLFMARELLNLLRDRQLPGFRMLNW